MRLFPLVPALGLLLLAGCVSMPVPAYQKVDQTAPAFQSAVAAETARLQASGLTARQAETAAAGSVTKQWVSAEAGRRKDLVAPLVRALEAMDTPTGCWAFTETTTTHKESGTKVEIARCDPSQPDDRLWTLVSTDGNPPDDEAQAAYRKAKVAREKNANGKNADGSFVLDLGHAAADDSRSQDENVAGNSRYGWVVRDALNDHFEVETTDATTTFVFDQGKVSVTLLASMDPVRQTYVLDNATGRVRSQTIAMGAFSALAGTMKIDHLDLTIEYAMVDPAPTPFVARVTAKFSGRFLLMHTGEVTVEKVFTDYHRVPCFQDRFKVKIGPLQEIDDILPH
jgi:outer membrane murein-binding lipoprotein Lpp